MARFRTAGSDASRRVGVKTGRETIDILAMKLSGVLGLAVGAGSLLGVVAIGVLVGRPPAPTAASPSRPSPPSVATTSPPPAASEPASPFMAALRRYEAEGNWVEFGVLAFNQASSIGDADRASALALLLKHQTNGGFPAMFCIARHQWLAGQKDEACRWFIRASVVYSIDAQRCTDATARQAVQGVRAHFGSLADYLKSTGRQTEWAQEALDFENTLADREPARWIAAHGMAAFSAKDPGAPAAFIPEEEWPAVRERARAPIAGSLAK